MLKQIAVAVWSVNALLMVVYLFLVVPPDVVWLSICQAANTILIGIFAACCVVVPGALVAACLWDWDEMCWKYSTDEDRW